MVMKHRFWTASTPAQGFWAEEVFRDADSLSKLESNLQKVAFPEDPAELNGHDPLGKVIGDGWEGLFEIIGLVFGMHPDLRMSDVVPAPPDQQGYDFVAVHTKYQQPVTIQCKFVGKSQAWETELRESETMRLERFLKASQNEADVPVKATDNMIVFTNAKNIHYFTSDILLYNKVRCIGREQITYLINKNPSFWDKARQMISDTNPYIKWK